MARRISTPTGATALPSREQIIAFLREAPGKVGKREIARAFGIAGADRPELKRLLRELEADGSLDRRGRS